MTTCRLVCPSAAALCVLLVAGMILCQAHCLWQLDAWSEPQEPAELTETQRFTRQLREDEDAVFAARAARLEAASDWIAGRSTLAETVERFRVIHAQLPTRLVPPLSIHQTEDERLCRCIKGTAVNLLDGHLCGDDILARLESELQDYLAAGANP